MADLKNIKKLTDLVGGASTTVGTGAMKEAVKEVKEEQAKKSKELAKEILYLCTGLADDAQKLVADANKAAAEIDEQIGKHLTELEAITVADPTPAADAS